MTPDLLIQLAVSIAGVAILVGVSWLLGAARSIAVTEEAAVDRLLFDEPDFIAAEWFIGVDGKAAAAISRDGSQTALVFALGDGLGTRRFRHGAIGIERNGTFVEFRTMEPSLRAVRLAARSEEQAEQWILRLAGQRL